MSLFIPVVAEAVKETPVPTPEEPGVKVVAVILSSKYGPSVKSTSAKVQGYDLFLIVFLLRD